MVNIMVSICCITYNHEDYIVEAIESFLMQKTSFKYEILIHDDASTDKTPEIIKQYESKYPDLIKPIYQTENQYSKGVKTWDLNRQKAKGKYIAICEGDDFWTDPYKLQKQVDYMEKHLECSLCVHAAHVVSSGKKLKSHIRPNYGNKVFTVEEVIQGGGGFFATNSILYPATFNTMPDFYKNAPVGDLPLVIYLSFQGTVYYIDEFMSVYRVGVPGSWATRMTSAAIDKRIKHVNEIAEMFDEINRYTNYEYDEAIQRKKKKNQWQLLLEQGKFKEAKSRDFEEMYANLILRNKVSLYMKYCCPYLSKVLIMVKRKLLLTFN